MLLQYPYFGLLCHDQVKAMYTYEVKALVSEGYFLPSGYQNESKKKLF